MGREIKFKVWDKEKQEMYFTDMSDNIAASNSIMECIIGLDKMGWHVAIRGFNEEEFTEIKDFELIQYTGLKDKGNIEICEGDIIEGGYLNPLTNEFLSKKYLVEHENGCFKGRLIGHSPYGDTWLYFIKGEVIGNIYEEPKLLEVAE